MMHGQANIKYKLYLSFSEINMLTDRYVHSGFSRLPAGNIVGALYHKL